MALRPRGRRYVARLAVARPLRVWPYGPPLHIANATPPFRRRAGLIGSIFTTPSALSGVKRHQRIHPSFAWLRLGHIFLLLPYGQPLLVAPGQRSATRGSGRQQKTRGGKPFEHVRYRNRHGTVAVTVLPANSEPLRGGAMSRPIFNVYRRAWAWVAIAFLSPGCAALNPRLG